MTQKAIDIFRQIKDPDDVSFTLLFNACARMKTEETFDLVKSVSSKMSISSHSNPLLLTSWLDALMTHEDVKRAEELFKISPIESLSIYGAMIKGTINTIVHQIFYVGDLFRLYGK